MRALAYVINRFYKIVIAIWIVISLVMGYYAIQLPGKLAGDGFQMKAENHEVMGIVTETFGHSPHTLLLTFSGLTDQEIAETIHQVEQLGIVSEWTSPLSEPAQYSEDFSYAVLQFTEQNTNMTQVVKDIRHIIADIEGVTLTGQAAISRDINTASQRDLMVAEGIGLPIAIIVLLFAFGTVVASLIPLIIGASAAIAAYGILTLIGDQMDLSIFIFNIVPMLGLALSIDFALLFINRYREERKTDSIEQAIETTMRTAGRAIIFSAFCVFIGLGAMMLIRVDIFRDIAIGGMLIVFFAVLSSVTLLPAILVALGERINRWQVLRLKQNGADRWRAFANGVIKRPIRIIIIAMILLGISVIPVWQMELTIPQIDALPDTYESRQAYEQVESTFDLGSVSQIYIIATRDDGWDDLEGLQQIEQLELALADDPLVSEVMTIFSLSGITTAEEWAMTWGIPAGKEQLTPLWENFVQGDKLLVPITIDAPGTSEQAQDWVRQLAEQHPSYDLLIGGHAKFSQEIFDEIADKILLVIALIMLTTFIVLMIAFRSILIPVKAILMNVVGLAATFGMLVYIFQYGHFGLQAGTIALIIPVIVFSLVFGLSMDYEVFLISRMQEEYARTQDNDRATVEGLAMTSKIITSAALIMIVLTGSFAIADVMPIKQIGVGIAIAVAIDASIIRLLLVPSLMKVFGKWNWWMPFRKGPYRID